MGSAKIETDIVIEAAKRTKNAGRLRELFGGSVCVQAVAHLARRRRLLRRRLPSGTFERNWLHRRHTPSRPAQWCSGQRQRPHIICLSVHTFPAPCPRPPPPKCKRFPAFPREKERSGKKLRPNVPEGTFRQKSPRQRANCVTACVQDGSPEKHRGGAPLLRGFSSPS